MAKTYQHLILGGARSGKSGFAERLVEQICTEKKAQKVYIATATAGDAEMAARIKRHQDDRDAQWTIIEEPIDLAARLDNATAEQCLLVDCLTLWLSNCLYKECWDKQRINLFKSLEHCLADVVMVSNEVGSGIIPMGELSRQFVDQAGWLHQALAKQCSDVSLVVAGLQSVLKTSNLR